MKIPIIKIEKPYVVVKLHQDVLEVDLKDGAKKELEDMVEAHPILRESIGILFQTLIPLDIALAEIKSAEIDEKGRLKIVVPHGRDIVVPLEAAESNKLVEKLNELIPLAKARELESVRALAEAEKRVRPQPREEL